MWTCWIGPYISFEVLTICQKLLIDICIMYIRLTSNSLTCFSSFAIDLSWVNTISLDTVQQFIVWTYLVNMYEYYIWILIMRPIWLSTIQYYFFLSFCSRIICCTCVLPTTSLSNLCPLSKISNGMSVSAKDSTSHLS